MEDLGRNLEGKFVSDSKNICDNVCAEFITFDQKALGDLLKHHHVDVRRLDHEERETRFEALVELDPTSKPIFYNVRRNMRILVNKLGAAHAAEAAVS